MCVFPLIQLQPASVESDAHGLILQGESDYSPLVISFAKYLGCRGTIRGEGTTEKVPRYTAMQSGHAFQEMFPTRWFRIDTNSVYNYGFSWFVGIISIIRWVLICQVITTSK